LVVIAIIGILAMMLLPAVQAAREAGRRVACQNNIRQVALAVGNYQSAKRGFPRSGDAGLPINIDFSGLSLTEIDPRTGRMHNWIIAILPFLEENALYDRFDFSRSLLDQPGNPQSVVLAPLICPSDDSGGSRIYRHPKFTNNRPFGKGNYAAYVSPMHVDLQHLVPGALVAHRQNTIRHIRDGLSNTMMLAEVRTRADELDQRGAWALPWTGSSVLAFDMHSEHLKEKASFIYDPLPPILINGRPLSSQQPPNNQSIEDFFGQEIANFDMLYHCDEQASQLDGMPCATFADGNDDMHYLSAAPRSRHLGGVYVTFMDSRVGFLLDEVDLEVMARMISIEDRRTLDFDEYVR
jgi:type II secretory pathway pseudopilin PulG